MAKGGCRRSVQLHGGSAALWDAWQLLAGSASLAALTALLWLGLAAPASCRSRLIPKKKRALDGAPHSGSVLFAHIAHGRGARAHRGARRARGTTCDHTRTGARARGIGRKSHPSPTVFSYARRA